MCRRQTLNSVAQLIRDYFLVLRMAHTNTMGREGLRIVQSVREREVCVRAGLHKSLFYYILYSDVYHFQHTN